MNPKETNLKAITFLIYLTTWAIGISLSGLILSQTWQDLKPTVLLLIVCIATSSLSLFNASDPYHKRQSNYQLIFFASLLIQPIFNCVIISATENRSDPAAIFAVMFAGYAVLCMICYFISLKYETKMKYDIKLSYITYS